MEMARLPLATWVDLLVGWMDRTLGPLFDLISSAVVFLIEGLNSLLQWFPWWLLILLVAAFCWYLAGWKLALGTAAGLLLIANLGFWDPFLLTLSLVLVSSLLCFIIGIPIGIWSAKNERVHAVVVPILDVMQTLPSFVYLLPAMAFFGIGLMPAAFATMVFAMPPVIRLTDLGIRQVPSQLVEAARAFGSSPVQMLLKVQLPLALPTMMAGMNQTIMLSLSMVVIASLIGAGGLGDGVTRALSRLETGMGFEYGIAVVILAMILDRITQRVGDRFNIQDKGR
ncbi:MAG: proline/glycine betaine ABC transporter permease [Bacillota bacterium]